MEMLMAVINAIVFITMVVGIKEIFVLNVKELKNDLKFNNLLLQYNSNFKKKSFKYFIFKLPLYFFTLFDICNLIFLN